MRLEIPAPLAKARGTSAITPTHQKIFVQAELNTELVRRKIIQLLVELWQAAVASSSLLLQMPRP